MLGTNTTTKRMVSLQFAMSFHQTTASHLFSCSVCHFFGTWNAGSTTPGEPYYAKWPDEFGNIKQRPVHRPECISRYFSMSKTIDVGNGVRQNELALERHWRTNDPWFRIDCTFAGITVTDSYLAAKKGAPSAAGIDKMSARDYAMHTVYDLCNYNISMEPKSTVSSATGSAAPTLPGATADTSPLPHSLLESIIKEHEIDFTDQRKGKANGGKGQLVRRVCQMGAEGCFGSGVTTECHHRVCKRKSKEAANRHGRTYGTFICLNHACKMKHYNDMFEAASSG